MWRWRPNIPGGCVAAKQPVPPLPKSPMALLSILRNWGEEDSGSSISQGKLSSGQILLKHCSLDLFTLALPPTSLDKSWVFSATFIWLEIFGIPLAEGKQSGGLCNGCKSLECPSLLLFPLCYIWMHPTLQISETLEVLVGHIKQPRFISPSWCRAAGCRHSGKCHPKVCYPSN